MRALYVSQTGMTEPLGRSQVIPYLRGLARAGWQLEIVGFEPATVEEAAIARVSDELAADGIRYSATRRSASHAPAVKVWEAGRALAHLTARALVRRPAIVHARSYLPGAVAWALAAALPRIRFVFDCRGLLGDEYVDGGHWSRDGLRYRVLKRVERILFSSAAAVVTLTEQLRRWLHQQRWMPSAVPIEVIPCCVDLSRFDASSTTRARSRQELGAGERFVLAYAGSLGSWYCEAEMARLFAALRRRRPSLFAIFSRSRTDALVAALRREGVSDDEMVVRAVAPEKMGEALAAADAGISFAEPWFSKIASSPVKVAEYLAVGAAVVMNRGIGDGDQLIARRGPIVDAGALSNDDLERAASDLASLPPLRDEARALARSCFDLEEVGIRRYLSLYERLAS